MIVAFILFLFIGTTQSEYTESNCDKDDGNMTTPSFRTAHSFALDTLKFQEEKLRYLLYSQNVLINGFRYVILTNSTSNYLNPLLETKIIISGYTETFSVPWIKIMKDTYLKNGRYNIIVLDWDVYSFVPFSSLPKVVRECGKALGNTIASFVESTMLDLTKIHIIGYSSGAQIAGLACRRIRKILKKRIARITALDMTGYLPSAHEVKRDVAVFVDAYHTSNYLLGTKKDYGTADFYIKTTLHAPNCIIIENTLKNLISCGLVKSLVRCIHKRSVELWIESITRNMTARSDNNEEVLMGEGCPAIAAGVYNYNDTIANSNV